MTGKTPRGCGIQTQLLQQGLVAMRFKIVLCGVALVAAGLCSSAHATPAPRPQEELERDSDLIIEADVECVAKVGTPSAPGWYARLRVRNVIKGKIPSNPMTYWFTPPEPDIIGTSNECVYAGERVRLYLVFEHNLYVPWASNSIDLLEGVTDEQRVLPHRIGQVITAPRKTQPVRVSQPSQCH